MKTVAMIALLSVSALAQDAARNDKPQFDYVPDSRTAIRIAVAVWEPIYGAKQIASEAPYRAVLKSGLWVVEGSLPEGRLGGIAVAEISQRNAAVLRIGHGQ